MFRKIVPILALATALMAQKPAPSALDKVTLEAYLRHLFVWPDPIQMTIADPESAPMPGYYQVRIKGTNGTQSQEETFYVSKDGQNIIRGVVYNVAQNPFKPELDKIKTDGQPAFGTSGAPVVIALFSDFECPYCKELAKTLRDNLVKDYPTEVRAYFFDFPLETLHPWAKQASIDGRCIFRQSVSAFWDYHDWIFENQGDVTADNLKAKVIEFGKTKDKDVDMGQLNSCMDTRATEADVNKTQALGHLLEVNQTPTMFVNGRRLAGSLPWEQLKQVIDFEIGYQKTAKNAGENCGCDLRLPMPGAAQPGAQPVGLGK